uniref:LysM domain-containing protein n=1 Tax=Daucus carota subsp. sativus TaxID=79200 RepID=A0A162ADQ3_DAUCS
MSSLRLEHSTFIKGNGYIIHKSPPISIGFKTVVCNKVYGAENGDTCSTVSAALNITPDFFGSINPNLNCSNIFVSEWLCINGTLI